jgi:hypothetical protein
VSRSRRISTNACTDSVCASNIAMPSASHNKGCPATTPWVIYLSWSMLPRDPRPPLLTLVTSAAGSWHPPQRG